ENEILNSLKEAISRYGTEHVDIIVDYNNEDKPMINIMYHSRHNSFGISKSYNIDDLNLDILEDICDDLDIGFCNYI
ncbi:MAG: hypothetical protein IJH34_17930, partial [Romboutsia sp.]|nr:hypothetical protein [Romboutsia sp.]